MDVNSSDRDTMVRNRWAGLVVRSGALFAVWLLLTGGSRSGSLVGAAVAAAAAALSLWLAPPGRLRLRAGGAARFVPFFLWRSLEGATDIALRALDPRLPLNPRFESYTMRVGPGPARVFFVGVVSLLPGTLSADVSGDELAVHVIGGARSAAGRLRRLENAVARAFGEQPPGEGRGG